MKFPKIKSKLILAPMDGVTNVAYRILCKKYGAGICYTEFISANGLLRNKNLLDVVEEERPVVAQIFGADKNKLLKAGKILEKKVDVIDFNIGCPSQKVVGVGAGSALLKNPEKVREILEALNTLNVPISCKMRLGVDEKSVTALEIAKIAEKSGCCVIAVHPRTQEQKYSGKANWDYIKKIKEFVSIPVIGNGDVFSPEDVKKMFDETGCDYVMIGRVAMKSPLIFKRANHYLKTGQLLPEETFLEKLELLKEYIRLLKKYGKYNDALAKQTAMHFSKGYRGSTKFRESISKLKKYEEIITLVEKFQNEN
jgi:nifR3 family TIM-barrel protein